MTGRQCKRLTKNGVQKRTLDLEIFWDNVQCKKMPINTMPWHSVSVIVLVLVACFSEQFETGFILNTWFLAKKIFFAYIDFGVRHRSNKVARFYTDTPHRFGTTFFEKSHNRRFISEIEFSLVLEITVKKEKVSIFVPFLKIF